MKGGRQDRTLGVDFVLPAKSGRVPVPSFCVESGRWHRRAREEAGSFSRSKSYLASKKLRMTAKMSKSQAAILLLRLAPNLRYAANEHALLNHPVDQPADGIRVASTLKIERCDDPTDDITYADLFPPGYGGQDDTPHIRPEKFAVFRAE